MDNQGKVIKFGDDIDTDVIISGRYLNISDPLELSKHCFENIRPLFSSEVEKGDILLVGRNFGCGSSREHAPLAIKAAGVQCIIAASFARIFYRNAINIGLPVYECLTAYGFIQEGAKIQINPSAGIINDLASGRLFRFKPFPSFIEEIIACGGLVAHVQNKMGRKL